MASDPVSLRTLEIDDVPELAEMMRRNRADMERTSPVAADRDFTDEGMRRRVEGILAQSARGERHYWTIRVHGELAGDIVLSDIQRGGLQRANLGYMVDSRFRGRGVATAAARLAAQRAFGDIGLHRLEAGVLPSNIASQRVLEKAGFRRVGLQHSLLFIAGRWEDHLLYELIGPATAPAMDR